MVFCSCGVRDVVRTLARLKRPRWALVQPWQSESNNNNNKELQLHRLLRPQMMAELEPSQDRCWVRKQHNITLAWATQSELSSNWIGSIRYHFAGYDSSSFLASSILPFPHNGRSASSEPSEILLPTNNSMTSNSLKETRWAELNNELASLEREREKERERNRILLHQYACCKVNWN